MMHAIYETRIKCTTQKKEEKKKETEASTTVIKGFAVDLSI